MSRSSSYVKHGKLTHAYSFSKRLPVGPTRSLRPFAAWVRKRVSVTRDPVRWHLPWGSRGGDQSGSGSARDQTQEALVVVAMGHGPRPHMHLSGWWLDRGISASRRPHSRVCDPYGSASFSGW
ncbi:hypothetical protein GW17_00043220 [Ensete ventricosum]|nr:hypothetical protein GW17_00043220 [Ensete ventricosum]